MARIIPLLFVAFILTAFVALRGQNAGSRVLGDSVENMAPVTEIRDVQLKEVKTKLENVVNSNKGKRVVQFRNEDRKVKVKVQTENESGDKIIHNTLELEPEEGEINLKIRESASAVGTWGIEKEVRVTTEGKDKLRIVEGQRETDTNFPITVNDNDNSISVTTPNREVKVRELPSSAVKNLLDNDVFSEVQTTEIKESSDGQTDAVLNVVGENNIKLFGFIPVKARVSAEVDSETGAVKKLNTPWYLSSFGFLFSK